jgi:hypothetical protein
MLGLISLVSVDLDLFSTAQSCQLKQTASINSTNLIDANFPIEKSLKAFITQVSSQNRFAAKRNKQVNIISGAIWLMAKDASWTSQAMIRNIAVSPVNIAAG